MSLRGIFFLALGALCLAQNLNVPSSWRVRPNCPLVHRLDLTPVLQEPNNSRDLPIRISLAQEGINAILPQLNSSTAQFNGESLFEMLLMLRINIQCRHRILAGGERVFRYGEPGLHCRKQHQSRDSCKQPK
jgi:hypothetical protein